MKSRRDRLQRFVGVLAIICATALVVLLLGGERMLSTVAASDGTRTLDRSAYESATRFVWAQVDIEFPKPALARVVGSPAIDPRTGDLIFAARLDGGSFDLYRARRHVHGFLDAEPLFELNAAENDTDPSFAGEGDVLVFASDRPGAGGFDLYAARRTADGFSSPEILPSLNSPQDDRHFSSDRSGERTVFASSRLAEDGVRLDLFAARREGSELTWIPPELLKFGGQESVADVRGPALSGDGKTLYYASDEGGKGYDLYCARSVDGVFQRPERVKEISGPRDDCDPALSPEGQLLIWAVADDAAGVESIHLAAAERREVFLVQRPGLSLWERLLPYVVGTLIALLLSYLYLRWERLHPLIKFIILSIIVHLLVLLYVRSRPGAPIASGQGTDAFHVEFLASADSAESSSASPKSRQGDRIEVARQNDAVSSVTSALSKQEAELSPTEPTSELSSRTAPTATPPAPRTEAEFSQAAAPEVRSTVLSDAAMEASALKSSPDSSVPSAAPSLASATAVGRRSAEDQLLTESGRPDAAPAPDRPVDVGSVPSALVARLPNPGAAEVAPTKSEALSKSTAGTPALKTEAEGRAREAHAQKEIGDSPSLTAVRAAAELSPLRAPVRLGGRTSPAPATSTASSGESEFTGLTASLQTRTPLTDEQASSPVGTIPDSRRSETSLGPMTALRSAREPAVSGPPAPEPSSAPMSDAKSFAPSRRDPIAALISEGRNAKPDRQLKVDQGEAIVAAASKLAARELDLADQEKVPETVYSQRSGGAKLEALRQGGGTDETEAAVLAGLRYLKSRQRKSGGFGGKTSHDKYGDFRVGKTGLALLAYLGSGYTQNTPGEFQSTVQDAIRFLIQSQDRQSGHFGDSEAYGHGIATYALAEAYAMTQDAPLRRPLERAVARILRAQVQSGPEEAQGGFGYYYADENRTFDHWPRLSVTVWQVMALKSASLGGLEIPADALDHARQFILGTYDEQLEAFRYNHDPDWLRSSYPTLPGSNSAALFALELLGQDTSDARFQTLVRYVRARRPSPEWRAYSNRDFAVRGLSNDYYLYYASLALFYLGGTEWDRWNREMTSLLVKNQSQDGSWLPVSYYANYCGDTQEDRVYTTAIGVLTLEVYYRYFTPLLSQIGTSKTAPK